MLPMICKCMCGICAVRAIQAQPSPACTARKRAQFCPGIHPQALWAAEHRPHLRISNLTQVTPITACVVLMAIMSY